MSFEFDSPQTLYSIHKATKTERRQAYTGGVPVLYALIALGVLAKLEAAGYGMRRLAHGVVRVTGGAVDVERQWRRARPATRDRKRLVFAEEALWHADRLERIAEEEERAEVAEDLKHVVFVL